jgi:battenin
MSGVLAALIYMGLTALGLSYSAIFLLSVPLVILYWGMYFFVIVVAVKDDEGALVPANNWSGTSWGSDSSSIAIGLPSDETTEENSQLLKDSGSLNTISERWAKWKARNAEMLEEVHRFTFGNNISLLSVYVAEYAVQFMAPFSFPCGMVRSSQNFWIKNSFVVTQFCYQCGVLVSRSSLACVRIRRVWVLSLIQGANAVAWFLQAKLQYIADPVNERREEGLAFVLFAWMIFVGLMGGASYVNVFYNILETTRESFGSHEDDQATGSMQVSGSGTPIQSQRWAGRYNELRQLSMNIGALYQTAGISLGALVDVVFSNTVLGEGCS